jgi:hypothetical protein
MPKFPKDAPKAGVVASLEALGFQIVREREHIAMVRENADGTKTPLVRVTLEPRAEKGDSHHLPVAEGDTASAEGRGLQTNGGCHLFPATPLNQV